MATWHDVMKVAGARELVELVRKGGAVGEDYHWQDPTQNAPVRVAVVDDGCDVGHTKLPAAAERYSFAGGTRRGATAEAMLNGGSSHGTMSAGIVVGRASMGDKFLGGVAADIPGVEFCPVRYNPGDDFNTDMAMYRRLVTDGVQVVSNSFGASYTSNQRNQLRDLIADSAAVFLFAAGNSNLERTEIDYLAPAVLVSASIPRQRANREAKAGNSNFGAGIFVCAPGGYDAEDEPEPISTVNRGAGPNGSNYGPYGDTSAACAMVAGVVTLMLLADPALGAMRIKEILGLTADKIDPNCAGTGAWRPRARDVLNGNQRGALPDGLLDRPYSRYYGFGRVNAESAVRMVLGM